MEFIKAEEFLKQPVEVQKVLLEWWKINATEFDLIGYIGKSPAYKRSFPSLVRNVAIDCFELSIEIIPLFTEGQLRKFIEDKTGCKISISPSLEGKYHVGYDQYADNEDGDLKSLVYLDNVLQAYWKVAIEIAKECVINE